MEKTIVSVRESHLLAHCLFVVPRAFALGMDIAGPEKDKVESELPALF